MASEGTQVVVRTADSRQTRSEQTSQLLTYRTGHSAAYLLLMPVNNGVKAIPYDLTSYIATKDVLWSKILQ